jgi:hypothetical protein
MSEIEDFRAKLRGDRDRQSDSGADRLGLRVLFFGLGATGVGLVLGLRLVLAAATLGMMFLAARVVGVDSHYEVQPLPASARNIVVSYQGKSASEIGEIADQVCARRTHERYPYDYPEPRMSNKAFTSVAAMNHYNALMHCLLTEGALRYCSAPERRMIVGEIARYFSLIAHHNRDYERWIVSGRDGYTRPLLASAVYPDPPVVGAIVSRLREGLLTKADRDQIIAAAPELRDRLVSIAPPKPSCPDEPWWAFWR